MVKLLFLSLFMLIILVGCNNEESNLSDLEGSFIEILDNYSYLLKDQTGKTMEEIKTMEQAVLINEELTKNTGISNETIELGWLDYEIGKADKIHIRYVFSNNTLTQYAIKFRSMINNGDYTDEILSKDFIATELYKRLEEQYGDPDFKNSSVWTWNKKDFVVSFKPTMLDVVFNDLK